MCQKSPQQPAAGLEIDRDKSEFMEFVKKHNLSFVEKYTGTEGSESFLIAKELIDNLFFEMAKLCTKYSNESFYDLPYTYRERQLDSVLLPALSKLCNSMVFAELPVNRECNNRRFHVEKSSGRLDYWCLYKDFSFVIELKHSYDCFTTPKTRERTITERWIKMNEQLQSLEKEIKYYEENTKGVIRIGLHIMTSYSDKTPNNQLYRDFLDSIPLTFERIQKDLSKRYPSIKPNLMICWKIPKKIVFKDREKTFPGLWAVAKIYSVIKHQGALV